MMRAKTILCARVAIVMAVVTLAPRGVATQAKFETTPTLFSGQAKAVSGTILGVPITLVDTGPVAAEGGQLAAHALCYPNGPNCVVGLPDTTAGALQVHVLNGTVVAQGHHSRAEASVVDLQLNLAGLNIAADFLQARASAQCSAGKAFVRGDSTVLNLVVNGESIAVTGDVNQRIEVPGVGAVVVINEQVATAGNEKGDITVRALHVTIPGVVDLVIAEAHADIICGVRFCPQDRDFVTGGGWLGNPRRSFAVAGGIKNGDFWGHLMYINHKTGLRAKGTGVTAYTVTGETTRHIEGTVDINGQPGTYQVDVNDKAEPGVGNDTFTLRLSNGEVASALLSGGNIQLHTCK